MHAVSVPQVSCGTVYRQVSGRVSCLVYVALTGATSAGRGGCARVRFVINDCIVIVYFEDPHVIVLVIALQPVLSCAHVIIVLVIVPVIAATRAASAVLVTVQIDFRVTVQVELCFAAALISCGSSVRIVGVVISAAAGFIVKPAAKLFLVVCVERVFLFDLGVVVLERGFRLRVQV